jgi:hypothetical protein
VVFCAFLDEAFGSADNVGLRFRRPWAKAGRVAKYVETEKLEAGYQKVSAGQRFLPAPQNQNRRPD